MKKSKHHVAVVTLCGLIAVLLPTAAQAEFVLVDDMEGTDNWNAFDGTPGTLVADPANPNNQVFGIGFGTNANNSDSYLSLGSGIAHNTTGTLFFRVRTTAGVPDAPSTKTFDWVFGTTTKANPGAAGTASAWNDFIGYGVMNSDGGEGTEMGVRNGPTAGGSFNFYGPASPDTWYNVWLVLNNSTKQTTMYYNTGQGTPASDPSTLSASGAFRNVNSDALIRLWARNNAPGSTGYMDDVYLDTTGENLLNPLSTPGSDTPPAITTFVSLGGENWELTLRGEPDTGYEFYSSIDLTFNPGTLITTLSQGDETNDPGTVTSGNLLTTDSSGNGKVRLTLSGNPADFVRAQAVTP